MLKISKKVLLKFRISLNISRMISFALCFFVESEVMVIFNGSIFFITENVVFFYHFFNFVPIYMRI